MHLRLRAALVATLVVTGLSVSVSSLSTSNAMTPDAAAPLPGGTVGAGLAALQTLAPPLRLTGGSSAGTLDATSAETHPVGFSPGFAIIDQRPVALHRDLDGMRGVGAGWVRIDVSWARAEPQRGRFDWTDTDRVIGAANARGLSVLAVIGYQPGWARVYRADGTQLPPQPAGFAEFAAAAAKRYSTDVGAWEVWNEPNLERFWRPRPVPAAYARLLRAAAEAIRANDPGDPILSGGLAPAVDAADGSSIAPETFLRRLYRRGVGGSFDAVAIHPYCYPELPTDDSSWNTFFKLSELHAIMTRRGDGDKRLWLTEYGAPTGAASSAVGDERQAAMLVGAYDEASRLDFAGPIFYYNYRDDGTDLADAEQNFGIVRRDRTPKPAWAALQGALSS